MKNFSDYLSQRKRLVDAALHKVLPATSKRPKTIHQAMRYSVFGGGKRVRPILCLATCQAVGGSLKKALDTACVLELLHTYSLIHDDLPCMDDDDLRRGRPTSHKVYGEGIAVLAGDALLTLVGIVLGANRAKLPAKRALEVIRIICDAAGSENLIGGQVEDLQAQGRRIGLSDLRYIHMHKTARLIEASVHTGALIGGASPMEMRQLIRYGKHIGLAFQVADDVLDVTGDESKMGKRVRKDSDLQKATYPAIVGMKASRAYLKHLTQSALSSLRSLDHRANPLREMALYLAAREA